MRRQSSDFCYGGTELLNGWACSHSSCEVEANKTEVLMHGLLSQQIVGVSFRSRKKIPLGLQGREPLPYQASHESFSLVMEKLCSKPDNTSRPKQKTVLAESDFNAEMGGGTNGI